jgi:hypothetical protein
MIATSRSLVLFLLVVSLLSVIATRAVSDEIKQICGDTDNGVLDVINSYRSICICIYLLFY